MTGVNTIKQAEQLLSPVFTKYEETAYYNQVKVLQAFQKYRVRDTHFNASSGYGYGDISRDTLEEIYAEIFKAEDAMVRSQIVSGTHAISACLFGLLRPGDQLISVTGAPYDTLGRVIGIKESLTGTLTERGIIYSEVPLDKQGLPQLQEIASAINENTRMVLIQRSRGYSLRPAVSLDTIEKIVKTVKDKNAQTIVMVDNCYGEFTAETEPIEHGADIIAGSLIKNPGGGLALSGGYIAGKHELVKQISYYLTAPGLGKELGASGGDNRRLYQGIFLAPHVVLQALKGAALLAAIFSQYDYEVLPGPFDERSDIVQTILLNNEEEVREFCQVIQNSSPVDSDIFLEFGDMPGYSDKIIMAAGTFIQGSSIELSCDAPLRAPYAVYIQGGLTYEHIRYTADRLVARLNLSGR
ncbi:MAG: methionine gamma-lyase family protein [Syntrophomonadaceae bacterium]|nr:methionine gamma-lyase family protein [Syntrophomonadaceae bacterium]